MRTRSFSGESYAVCGSHKSEVDSTNPLDVSQVAQRQRCSRSRRCIVCKLPAPTARQRSTSKLLLKCFSSLFAPLVCGIDKFVRILHLSTRHSIRHSLFNRRLDVVLQCGHESACVSFAMSKVYEALPHLLRSFAALPSLVSAGA